MSLKIRLARGGAKKRPHYRIVVSDSRMPRDGRYIERLGTYDPLLAKDNESRVTLKDERIRYWLDKGAKPTDRVARFLGSAEIIPMPAQKNNPQKAKPKAKAQERLATLAEAEENAKAEEKKLSDEEVSEKAAEEIAEAEEKISDEEASEKATEETSEK